MSKTLVKTSIQRQRKEPTRFFITKETLAFDVLLDQFKNSPSRRKQRQAKYWESRIQKHTERETIYVHDSLKVKAKQPSLTYLEKVALQDEANVENARMRLVAEREATEKHIAMKLAIAKDTMTE